MTNETQIKPLEILVVEDNPAHLLMAREEVKRRLSGGAQINVDFATYSDEATRLLQTKTYSAIVSDIFIPSFYDESGAPKVTEEDRALCYNLIPKSDYTDYSYLNRVTRAWMKEQHFPPLGMKVAEECLKQKLPVVFCTDRYHHSDLVEPVCGFSREGNSAKRKILLIDCCKIEHGDVVRDFCTDKKDWNNAISSAIFFAIAKRYQFELPRKKSYGDGTETYLDSEKAIEFLAPFVKPYDSTDFSDFSKRFECNFCDEYLLGM